MIDRTFTVTCQLVTTAPDPATAQAQVQQAQAAITTALSALPGVFAQFSMEEEDGQVVFQEA